MCLPGRYVGLRIGSTSEWKGEEIVLPSASTRIPSMIPSIMAWNTPLTRVGQPSLVSKVDSPRFSSQSTPRPAPSPPGGWARRDRRL